MITVTTDHEYYLLNTDNLTKPIKMQFSKKKNIFPNFFLHFKNLDQILNILKKKMTLKAYVFPKLRSTNEVTR